MGSYGVIEEFKVEYIGISSLRELKRVLSSINGSICERVKLGEKYICIFM